MVVTCKHQLLKSSVTGSKPKSELNGLDTRKCSRRNDEILDNKQVKTKKTKNKDDI